MNRDVYENCRKFLKKYPGTIAWRVKKHASVIQRHINALLFADFVARQGGIRVTATLNDFFVESNGMSHLDSFLNHIDMIVCGQQNDLEVSYCQLVKGTVHDNLSLGDASYITKKAIMSVYNVFNVHISSLNKSLEVIREEDGSGQASRAIQRQKDIFLKTSLLSYLAENSFLPSAGIPTGLVECMLNAGNDTNNPTMHLSQAISSYAPGNQVVKNEWIYEPSGIRLRTKYDDNTSRYILQNCISCGYTTIIYGNAMNHCPKCGKQNSMHGIKNMSIGVETRFTEVVEPAAFSVAWGAKPNRKMKGVGTMNFIQPVLLEMEPWPEKISSAKMTVRCSTSRSEILFYNRGRNGFGYAFCPYCGKMENEKEIDTSKNVLIGHKHLTTGVLCPGGNSVGNSVRRHVLLVGRYQTDFVEIKFYDGNNLPINDAETLYSLGVIFSRKLTELLGVNEGEIDFGYSESSHSIFIYDTALGGAGYSPLFREYKDKILDMAYDTLYGCDCERSCTKCLIDRHSQWYLNYLDRQKVLQWLEMEHKSRVAPQSIISFASDAKLITTDFTTEVCQLFRNKNVKTIRLFLNDKFSSWQISDFPYIKLINGLCLENIDVAFVLNKNVTVSSVPSSARTILMSALLQYKFCISSDIIPHPLTPLLSVVFNDGTTKTYFGENLNTMLASTWGNGDVYSTMLDLNFSFTNIDVSKIVQSLTAADDSIMFDIRIKDDCHIDSLFTTIANIKTDKWDIIKNVMHGKHVSVEYSDRYLCTPLGCVLLAHFIASIKDVISVYIEKINVSVIKTTNENNCDVERTSIDSNFKNSEERCRFLRDAISALVGVEPFITDEGYIEHERCLTIKTNTEELCLRPDAGIANGWKPYGRDYLACNDQDFRDNWNMEMRLFNQKKKYAGILYTISFNSVGNVFNSQ